MIFDSLQIKAIDVHWDAAARLWRISSDGELRCDSAGRLYGWESFSEAWANRSARDPKGSK